MAKKSHGKIPAWLAKRKRLWIAILFLMAIVAVLACIARFSLDAFLAGSDLRDRLSGKTAEKLNADGGYLPLSWQGLSVHSAGFEARSQRDKGLTRLLAERLDARCGIMDLWHGKVVIHHLTIGRLQAAYGGAAAKQITGDLPAHPELKAPDRRATPIKVDVQYTTVDSADILWGRKPETTGGLKNTAAILRTVDKDLDIEGKGGELRQSGLPALEISRFHLYYTKPRLLIKESSLAFSKDDHVSITGELTFGDKAGMKLELKCERSPVANFLPEDWRRKFRGKFSTRSSIAKVLSEESEVEASGVLDASGATLQGVDAQHKVALLTRKPQFERLAFSKLDGEYTFEKNKLEVRKFEAAVEGLFVVKGSFTVLRGEIDATLRLGVNPSVIEGIPGAREHVFTESADGYSWTPVKLGGPLKHPREDLSPRLLAAAKKKISQNFLGIASAPEKEIIGLLEALSSL